MTHNNLFKQGAMWGKLHMFKQRYLNDIPTMSKGSARVAYPMLFLLRFAAVFLMLLTLGVGNAWGDTATNDCSTNLLTTYADMESGKAIEWKAKTATSYTSPLRVYQNNVVTFHCKAGASAITKIEITANNGKADYGNITRTSGNWSVTEGGGSIGTITGSGQSATIPITGTATSITFTASAQTRWDEVIVTYTASDASTLIDKIDAAGFAGYTTGSYSAQGTDRSAVANYVNATGSTYALQVYNGSTGAVKGNGSGAANFSCRNTTTKSGYYISEIKLTVSGGTIDGSTSGRSVVYFGTSAYTNPNTTAPSGTYTSASPSSSGQSTLTWSNSNESKTYFILYNLKTASTASSARVEITWKKVSSGYTLVYGANLPAPDDGKNIGASGKTETNFTQDGTSHLWQITNFAIPATNVYFYVGSGGTYKDSGLGTSSSSARHQWSDAPSVSSSIWQGQMHLVPYNETDKDMQNWAVGHAAGAKGTVSIYDDSSDRNLFVGFQPDGYGITYGGGSGHAFTETATSPHSHVWESEMVTLPADLSATYNIGLATATSGTYVTCAHSESTDQALSTMGHTSLENGLRKIWLYATADSWIGANAKMAIWDGTNSHWGNNTDDTKFMTKVNDNLWYGYVPTNATTLVIARVNPNSSNPDFSWGQTYDITPSDVNNYVTITGVWSNSKAEYSFGSAHPTASTSGKFRMWDNNSLKNWCCHFVPYWKLTYDLNDGSATGAPSAQYVCSEGNDASRTVALTMTGPELSCKTFLGWATTNDAVTPDYATGSSQNIVLTDNTILYAVWQTNTYTISYATGSTTYTSGNAISGEKANQTKTCNVIFTLPNVVFTTTGYTQDGWSKTDGGGKTNNLGGTYSTDADQTFFPHWAANSYTITYKDQGGGDYSGAKTDGVPTGAPTSHTYGSPTVLVDGSKDNYVFNGWFTNSACTEGPVTSLGATDYTDNIILYAKWTERVAVTFSTPDGVDAPSASYSDVALPSSVDLPSSGGVAAPYWKFVGWTESSSYTGSSQPTTFYPAGGSYTGSQTSAFTLYAVYAREKYEQVYDISELEANKDYIITYYNGGTSNEYALKAELSDIQATNVNVYSNSKEVERRKLYYEYMYTVPSTVIWHLTGSTGAWQLQNGSYYVNLSNSTEAVLKNSGANMTIVEGSDDDEGTFAFSDATTSANKLYFDGASSKKWSITTSETPYFYMYKMISSKYMTNPAEPTYTIHFSVNNSNGNRDVAVYDGIGLTDAILNAAKPADNALSCANAFIGWSENAIDGTTNTMPTDLFTRAVNGPVITGEKTFYAVFATASENSLQTVTYPITSYNSFGPSTGTAPTGSSAAFVNTYTTNKNQMTAGNSQTVTLTDWGTVTITKMTLNMHSNASKGAGKLSYSLDGGSTDNYLVGNTSYGVGYGEERWYGSYTTTSADIPIDAYFKGVAGENIQVKIAATENSLFCTSYSFTYGTLSSFVTTCCATMVGAPSVTAEATKNSIALSWADVTGADAWQVTINGGTHSVNKATHAYTAENLDPNTDYTWEVIATYSGDYCGATKATGTTKTLPVYGVTYDKNTSIGSGSVSMTPMPSDGGTYAVGETVTAALEPATQCSNAGYTFSGWNTQQDGEGTHVDAGGEIAMVAGGLTLYAEWTPKLTIYVDCMHENGDGEHTQTVQGKVYNCYYRYGYHTAPTPLDNATGDVCQTSHYHFLYWQTQNHINMNGANAGTQKDTGAPLNGGANHPANGDTYYAIWAEEVTP